MKRLFQIVYLCGVVVFLAACSKTKVQSGPSIELGPIQVGLYLNSDGKFVLDSQVSVPVIPIPSIGGVNWTIAFETTLNDANDTHNYLYILWDPGDGITQRQAYDISQPFDITFEHSQWVRRISRSGDGNIVVYVEIQEMPYQTQSNVTGTQVQEEIPNTQVSENVLSCLGPLPSRLSVGMKAEVTTSGKAWQLRLRSEPGFSSSTNHIIAAGRNMVILDGPKCADGSYWWYVRSEQGFEGWAPEGDNEDYWIDPLP